MRIIPVQPESDPETIDEVADLTGASRSTPSRRTFGRKVPSRRTFARKIPSRRTFGARRGG